MSKYSIRNITRKDIFKIKEIRNEQMNVLRQSRILTDNDQKNWYNNIILPSYKNKKKTLNFTILYDNRFIGYGGLVNIDYVNKKAEISFLVEKNRTLNKKLYQDDFSYFLRFISKYSFEELNLHKVWTETYEFRNFHMSILEKEGFKREGLLKDTIIQDNEYFNSILHGLILDKKLFDNKSVNKIVDYKTFFNNKTILVTGSSGIIGTDLVLNLINLNIKKIICIDLKEKPKEFNNSKIEYYQKDVNNLDIKLVKKFNPEILFHLAATFERTRETLEFWEESFKNNVKLSNHVGTICKNLPNLERVVFTSSYLIYNSDLYTFYKPQINPVIINEDTPILPRNICGAAKLLHEVELNYFSHFKEFKFTCVTPRIFRVFGPGECGRLGGTIINRWINSLLAHEEIPLSVYAKEGIFDYIYSEDIAFSLILLAASNHKGVINIGKGEGRTINEVLHILKSHFPKLTYKEIDSDIKYEACQSNMDKFYEVTGWKPTTSLEKGIKKCIDIIKKKNNL